MPADYDDFKRRADAVLARIAAACRQAGRKLIGHLQSNKARLAAQHFDRIQSVDSVKLAQVLDRVAGELGKKLPIMLQVNAGLDPAKSGVEPDGAAALLEAALGLANLRVDGLMTIAPLSDDPAVARRTFDNLRAIRDGLREKTGAGLGQLSMGMSGDIEAAIAAGSTIVRVGSALFGAR
jgi:pyridoxal phosphate enzyme (YggS family)